MSALEDAQAFLDGARAAQRRTQGKLDKWRRRAENVQANITEAEATIRRLSYPPEPKPQFNGHAPIVRFVKSYRGSPKHYSFAAILGSGRWYVTGQMQHGLTWQELCDFVRKDNVLVAKVPTVVDDTVPF